MSFSVDSNAGSSVNIDKLLQNYSAYIEVIAPVGLSTTYIPFDLGSYLDRNITKVNIDLRNIEIVAPQLSSLRFQFNYTQDSASSHISKKITFFFDSIDLPYFDNVHLFIQVLKSGKGRTYLSSEEFISSNTSSTDALSGMSLVFESNGSSFCVSSFGPGRLDVD